MKNEKSNDKLILNVPIIKNIVASGLSIVPNVTFISCLKEFCQDNVTDDINFEQTLDINVGKNLINVEDLDFSDLTVVLGKTSDTKELVNSTINRLNELGITTYISDSPSVTAEVAAQAAMENPNDDILAINIGGEKNNTGKTIIMANYVDGYGSISGIHTSDSLALMLDSEIGNSDDKSTIVHGKCVSEETNSRGKTVLEEKIKEYNLSNPGVKTVTIAIDSSCDYTSLPDGIVNAIIKYETMSREKRDTIYLGFKGIYSDYLNVSTYDSNKNNYYDTVQIKDCENYNKKVKTYVNSNTKK